jgi:AcrR family transcriptional regulator
MIRQSDSPQRERAAHLGPEKRRPLVLDAAMSTLLEHGYDGTSMAAIAEAAGVSKPVVYDCFAGKAELMKALFQREEARVMAEIRTSIPALESGDPEHAITEAYTAFLRAVAASPDVYRLILLGEGGVSAAVAGRVRRGRLDQVGRVVEIVGPWLDSRGIDANPKLLAYAIVGLGEAAARALLGGVGTPEQVGAEFGRLAARALPAG